ncbi:MAG: GNAT family N-acetyltransferase [Candidatus Magasanikbacteria bacterium CG11_big_fil_rev_8_21_14_0_20_43_7]|uniref:GNAT family N-acetyltransferase n=1 Tax=Candidatus Magasanikbacteria bacterium CG11_big_fil_rev_8_21_14_0_20_43_7 TaxID=1974654 RepID=A0A2H0N2T4_9BACT|nr:MAG: GNAT family N-acetyltransferase [Candidatus Magasanikbacteria bacterium CG11_big_fil_rev_8_21_14_0_20_43_7]
MFPKKIILNNDLILTIREARIKDAKAMIGHMHIVSTETDFLTYGAGEFLLTLKEEEDYIRKTAQSDHEIFLLAEVNNHIIGIGGIHSTNNIRTKHIGNLGLAIQKKWWGIGIGSYVLEGLIDWAKKNTILRKIDLFVVENNHAAITLYKKFGFQEEGLARRTMYIKGTFFDAYTMGLLID